MDSELVAEMCHDCIPILLWAWGHGIDKKTLTVLENVGLIRLELRKQPSDFGKIEVMLDMVEKIIEEVSELPSPFLLERVSMNALIKKRIEELQHREPYKSVAFQLDLNDELIVVHVNAIWIRRMVDIIVDNALDAISGSPRKEIIISSVTNGNEAIVSIRDTGKGIDEPSSLFAKPYALQPNGKGRGGYVAKMIAEIYNGTIDVAAADHTGTTIIIRLPLKDSSL